jgi:hypothetical protein
MGEKGWVDLEDFATLFFVACVRQRRFDAPCIPAKGSTAMMDRTKLRQWLFVAEMDGAFEVYLEGEVDKREREKEPYYELVAAGFATRADAERFIAEFDPSFFARFADDGGQNDDA